MWITKTSINQPVFATMVMLALLVLGLFSYQRLPVEQMPDVSLPMVFVEVRYPGASPEAIESDMLRPIENVVNTVNGIKRSYGTAREGIGFMMIEFRLDTDMAMVTQEIRDKIADLQPTFPREAKNPVVSRSMGNENQQPVMNIAVHSSTRSLRELSTLTDQIAVKSLQTAAGVGRIAVNGSVVRQIQVLLKPDQMRSYGVGIDEVIAAIQAANQDLPAGTITRGATEQLVRIEGRIKDPKAFGRIIVTTRGSAVYLQQGGVPVHLDQVAEIIDGEAEPTSIARLNGHPSISLNVFKVQGANVVGMSESVEETIKDLNKRLPPDVKVTTVYSNAEFVKASLKSVKVTILEGGLLTVFVVFLFLHSWRSTVITGLTLPISVIATFIALYALGYTLNFITLMALSLCIGLLIDDAIVVRENIVRHLGMGKSHLAAARDGTEEIGLAVMATTFAILAVFVPVSFMAGIIGLYFYQFGITVAVAVSVSLFVSFTLDPMLSAVWRDPAQNRFAYLPWLGRLMDRIEGRVEALHHIYGRVLAWALRSDRRRFYLPVFGIVHAVRVRDWRQIGTLSHRGMVLWSATFIFFGSFLLVPMIGSEFIPQNDEGFISLRLNTPIGSSLPYVDTKTRQVEEALKGFAEIETVDTTVGTEDGKNYSRINLRLIDKQKTQRRSQKELEQAIRARVTSIAGIVLSVGFDKPIFVSILGPDASELTRLSQELMAKIAKIPGIADLESSETGANPTVAVRINQELASDLGLTTERIGRALRPLVAGEQVSHWLGPDGQDYDVTVQLPRGARRIATDLGDLYLTSDRLNADGQPLLVPLRQVAEFVETTSPQQIKRLNLQRRVSLYAGVEGRAEGDVGADVERLLTETQLPPGYRFDIAGQQQDMNDSFKAMLAAMGLAVIFIYFILASQFGSFLQPVAIMASLPLSLSGVFVALLVTGTTLNMFSMIGFIMLMGLVTKNAILLVDFANQGLRQGKSIQQALLDAGQVRLRPIMMTTLAMIFGMLPMAIGGGSGSELNAPMGRAVIGGIITSTLLTLVVVPVLYSFLQAFAERMRHRRSAAEEVTADNVMTVN